MNDDESRVLMVECVTLEKFEGAPPKAGEDKKPIETIRLKYINGELVTREDYGTDKRG